VIKEADTETPTLADLLKQLETGFQRARKWPVLPAPQIPQARDTALAVVSKLPEDRAIRYLTERALPAVASGVDFAGLRYRFWKV